ncbi:MAG: hypothetical protein WCN95_08565 [bacterium]
MNEKETGGDVAMKKNMKSNGSGLMTLLSIVFVCGTVVMASAESTVTKTDGTVVKVKALRWVEGQASFNVVQADGSTFMLPKASIEKIEMDKPPKFALAESQLNSKQFDAAIFSLESVVSEYAKQGWDVEAASQLAEIYLRKNDPKKAAAVMETVVRGVAKIELSADAQLMYWKALLGQGAGSMAKLKVELDEAIATGQRDIVAAAYIARGGMNHIKNDREAALLDYLRVVILFENVKSIQPEALFKAAALLDELKDRGGRGDILRRMLIDKYPESSYTTQARSKMS